MVAEQIEDIESIFAEQPIQVLAVGNKKQPEFDKAKDTFERGFQCQIKGDYKQAIELYKDVAILCSNRYESYYNMALCYKKLQQVNDAIEHFEKAASLNRFYKPIFLHLARLYSDKGDQVRSTTNWTIFNYM